MKTFDIYLKEAINNKSNNLQNIEEDLMNIYNIKDIDKFVLYTFEDYCNDNNILSNFNIAENNFYKSKFNSYSDKPSYIYYQTYLYERLKDSLKTNNKFFITLLNNISGIENIEIINNYLLKIFYNDIFNIDNIDFLSLLNFGNYYIQFIDKDKQILQIEANKPKELKNYNYKKLYHVTNKYFYERIKKYGLIPNNKSNLVYHPDRIYLWSDYDEKLLKSFGRMNLLLYKKEIDNNKSHNLYNKININDDIIILDIDIEKFNREHDANMILYGDPSYNSNSAIFTLEPIPTKYISSHK